MYRNNISDDETMSEANQGLIAILSKLDEDTLFSLARTVTQGLKKIGTTKDAIENIMRYSPDHISVLRRKALTKELLFNYLDENNIKVQLPTTKNGLIDTIASTWNIPCISSRSQEELDAESASSGVVVLKTSKEESNVNMMAKEFSKWFYSQLNSNECDIEHFFPDAKLKINMYSNDDCETIEIEDNPEEVANTLLKVRLQHNLYFNPNDTIDGIQGRINHYGLVMVLTCGTLHIQSVCAGVFEQVFALARDPFCDNNWKIKYSELNLRSKSSVFESPKLCDSELTSELLMLPSE